MERSLIYLISGLLLVVPAYAGQLYKWTDEAGHVHITNTPPETRQTEDLKIFSYETPEIKEIKEEIADQPPEKNQRQVTKKVVMYSAAWCHVCKKAKAYFNKEKVPYDDYDVETTKKGKRDFSKLRGKGVPIILVGNSRMNGFSPAGFERLYGN